MIEIQKWGIIDYDEAWNRQRQLFDEVRANPSRNILALCSHPTVITIGKNGKSKNLLGNPDYYKMLGIKVIFTDRGGDVTLHNPGQLVGYPVFSLQNYKKDLHWFLREIEKCIIELIGAYGILGGTIPGLTGVWVDSERKIAALGFHCSRWITYHGFALNVINDISEFSYIVPCGIEGKGVTSITIELKAKVDYEDVIEKCIEIFRKHF